MRRGILLDTGPLVAYLNRRDRFHDWAVAHLVDAAPPLTTCDAVLSEACFLLRHLPGGPEAVVELLRRGLLALPLRLAEQAERIGQLMARYADVPMSLADACLVRLAELTPGGTVLTLDRDFRTYRMHGRRVIAALLPPKR